MVMSCFPFDHLNGILKSYVHGSKNPELQISSAVITYLMFEELKGKVLRPDSEVFKFCELIEKSGTHRRKTRVISEGIFAVGLYKKSSATLQYIIDALENNRIAFHGKTLHLFQRILLRSMYVETESYACETKTNSSCIGFKYNELVQIGIVEQFFTLCDCACSEKCEA
ncbi:hypothetical protein QAD02_012634 [Eretmocerus hayati]|uniref:Uncharacterized protein n=1 Tax=Eretmocerus hayati TaxID=131215 RepID=A0ACC2P0D6_9HYME|nr:hypothetical protein QAD02_012634 [Eretmocerus hayati]